jgi:L-lactate dehydrogenase complex protein LldG
MYSRVARSRGLFTASQKFAALASFLAAPFSPWIRLPAVTGWGYSKDFPRFAGKTFRERFRHRTIENAEILEEKKEISETVPLSMPKLNLVEQFTKELTSLGGKVQETRDLSEEIVELLKAREINRIHLEPGTLNESMLRQAGIEFTYEPDPSIRLGVTKAICGLADTGSILETDGEGSPLHASLLTETHIAVLRKSDILPSLSNAMHLVKEKKAATFITGPSRTADIEMTLTIGVHGPREIMVFLVP